MGIIIEQADHSLLPFQSKLSLFSRSAGETFAPRLGALAILRARIESSSPLSIIGLCGGAGGGVNRVTALPVFPGLRPKRFLLGLPPSQLLRPVPATLLSTVAGVAARWLRVTACAGR